jgi:hypothetical protein
MSHEAFTGAGIRIAVDVPAYARSAHTGGEDPWRGAAFAVQARNVEVGKPDAERPISVLYEYLGCFTQKPSRQAGVTSSRSVLV